MLKEHFHAMVSVLNISDTTMTPDELVEYIRQRRNDSSLEAGVEQKIMEVTGRFDHRQRHALYTSIHNVST